jgi:subtilisin family serine protease
MPLFITMRIRPDVKPETLKYLASVAEEEKVVVQPSSCSVARFPLDSVSIAAPSPHTGGCDLKGVVRDYYGLSLPKLRALVTRFVPALGDLLTADQPISVSLPASLKGTVGLKVKPERSLTLRQLALSLLGQDGPRTRKNVERANPSLAGKWDHLVTHSVTIPFVARVVSYRLRAPFAEQPETVVRKLKEDPAVLSAEVTRGYRIVPSYRVSSIPPLTPPEVATASPNWPLETLPADWTDFDKPAPRLITVAVADTGLDSNDSRFRLWTNYDAMGTPAPDYEAQKCVNYLHGCNLLNPAAEPNDDSADHHGTHVAGLASARLYSHPEELNNRIELMILKVADSDGYVKTDALESAVTYGCDRLAKIMNLSLTGDYSTHVENAIKSCGTVLYVAAAGNSASLDSTQACNAGHGIDFDDKAHPADQSTGYPARLASQLENVISVAAADTQGHICDFSNRGKQSVSLVAPGYGVTSTAPDGTAVLNGSSQATALVTLAAALLYSQGYTSTTTVKHRIIASTDFVPDLRDKVFSAGMLNILKALNFKQDAIHYSSGLVEYGTIVSPQYVYSSSQANGLYLGCAVYRIVPNYSSTDPNKRVELTVLNAEKRLEHQYTDHLDRLSFRTAQGVVKTVSPDDLLDIVPHPRVCQ